MSPDKRKTRTATFPLFLYILPSGARPRTFCELKLLFLLFPHRQRSPDDGTDAITFTGSDERLVLCAALT